MKLFAHDLALARAVYGDAERVPEMTLPLAKVTALPAMGERVTLHNKRSGSGGPATAECEAEVVGLAVVVKPDWSTYRNPHAERQQESLL